MNRWTSVVMLLAAFAVAPAALAAQAPAPGPAGEQTPPKGSIIVEPGRGPQIPFDEARWEFWFYFNRDGLLGLRPALAAIAPGKADVDQPFVAPTEDDREQSVIPALVQCLRDKNPGVRIAAAHALAKTQDPAVRPYLIGLLHDPEFAVRLQAVVALGVWGNTIALPRLEEILADDDAELQMRQYAAVAMGLVGGPKAAESFRAPLAPATFKGFPKMVQEGLAFAVGLTADDEGLPPVRALLGDRTITDDVVRSYLALSLGRLGTEADEATLVGLLADPEAQVRRSAAIALGVLRAKSADEQAVAALTKAARNDADLMVRNLAYVSLGSVGGTAAGETLRAELGTVVQAHRPFVALGLGMHGDPAGGAPLLDRFKSEGDLSTRAALAVSLGLLKHAAAREDLREAFRGVEEPVFRGYVGLALGMLGDHESIVPLRGVFTDETDVELIPNCAIALGLLGDRDAAAALVQRADREKNEFVLQSVLYAIGLVGDRSAIPALTHVLDGAEAPPAYIRSYAAAGLGLLGDPAAQRAIARLSRDSNYTIQSNFVNQLFMVL